MGLARLRGRAAEAIAAAYLELLGYEVVSRNVRMHGVEVDLVAREGRTHVLVEVKCRSRSDYGGAALAVDHGKRARLLRAAQAVALGDDGGVRIDVVAIEIDVDGATLRHYRNAVTE